MKISELIEALKSDLWAYGDIPVRVETDDNQEVHTTLRANYSGESTLFLMLGPEEAE